MSDLLKEVTRLLQENKLSSLMEREEAKNITLDYNSLPLLSIVELPWANPETQACAQEPCVAESARDQVEQFLEKIAPGQGDIQDKLVKLEAFFPKPGGKIDFAKAGIDLNDQSESIGKILGYLMFFKTLTSIVQNFNAASAGFTFEAFLAVLLGGKQIPAAAGDTIADITDQEGNPISLKLLAEKHATVEGSFKQLVDDFHGKDPSTQMQYIVCLKDLTKTGKTVTGQIKFFRFYYKLETFLKYIGHEKAPEETTKACLRLPKSEIKGEGIDLKRFTPEEDIQIFMDYIQEKKEEYADKYSDEYPGVMNREEVKALLLEPFKESLILKDSPRSPLAKIPAISARKARALERIRELSPEDIRLNKQGRELSRASQPAVNTIVSLQNDMYNAIKKEYVANREPISSRNQAKSVASGRLGNWASFEDSYKHLDDLRIANDYKGFFDALTNSYGYVNNKQWHLSKSVIEATSKDTKSYVGRLHIGSAAIVDLINQCSRQINEKMFEIFSAMSALSNSLNSYFAKGLPASMGQQAIDNTKAIEERTKTFMGDIEDIEAEGGSPGTPEFKSGSEAGQDSMRADNRQAPGVGLGEHKITLTDLDSLIESMVKGTRNNKS